ncbi:ADP-ribosylglycohydrolase family protein [Streptomyces albidoflavus]|uniref:ADP-ribosylglycohydrolase family protein n=1 Tax=Streptomyces albidoflavus TaxID=1886 RepID=UPI00101FC71C|nr:ADP-ribosylglycohydrolase family protein [Streptomyces albidoflavus]RZE13182.1 ADP-ribosylglycohydrolase [Streptomyces albidoflavus]
MGTAVGTVWGRAEQQDFRSRVRGTLLGAALGDALGAPLAGLGAAAVREVCGDEGPAGPGEAYGRRGAVTAHTQLSLFTVDGLIRAQVRRDTGAWHPPTDVHLAYRRWAATQSDWGPDERRTGDGWLARQEWLYSRRGPERSCLSGFGDRGMGTLEAVRNPGERGPGALTRSAPFGLLVGWDPGLVLQLALECAAQSHGHPAARLAAGAYALLVHGAARGEPLETATGRVLALAAEQPGGEEVGEALRAAVHGVRQGPPDPALVEELAGGGEAEGVLAAALYAALVCEDVSQGLRLAVRHGGPSPAVGAVCGGLLGALHGETALPPAWLAELEGRATVLELADDFALEMTHGAALHGPEGASPGWLARYPRA